MLEDVSNVAMTLLRLLFFGTWFAVFLVLCVLLPLTVPKVTRPVTGWALFFASYLSGATLWLEGLLVTLANWGFSAVLIGLVLLGMGVVPVAMLGTLFKGMWASLIELIVLAIMTYGARLAGVFVLGLSATGGE
jgi:uncharacterized membrane protein